jgi:hypothetical protein
MMNRLPIEWVDRIFMRLHGRFGNSFTDKFKLGQIVDGVDIGIANAKQVWAEELAGISPNRIKNALLHNYEYAPSCDQFKAQCRSTMQAHQDFIGLPRKFTAEERESNRKRLQTTLDSLNIKRVS